MERAHDPDVDDSPAPPLVGRSGPPPAVALGPEQLGLIVNTADPYSVEIGAHYARRRGIPPANVVFVTLPAGRDEISREEFETAKAEADARLP